jgi:hypothetical protein
MLFIRTQRWPMAGSILARSAVGKPPDSDITTRRLTSASSHTNEDAGTIPADDAEPCSTSAIDGCGTPASTALEIKYLTRSETAAFNESPARYAATLVHRLTTRIIVRRSKSSGSVANTTSN